MARSPLPRIDPRPPAEVATLFRAALDRPGIARVRVSRWVRLPPDADAFLRGGITRVPFLIWCREGSGRIVVGDGDGGDEIEMTPGDLLVHCAGSYVRMRHDRPAAYLRATIDTDHVLAGLGQITRARDMDDPDDWRPLAGCVSAGPLGEPARGLLDRLLAPATDDSHRRAAATALIWELIDRFADGRGSDGRWLALRGYLAEHLARPLSRTGVARVFGIHPNHLSRMFRRHAPEGFARTLLRLRLERASELLIATSVPVAEVGRRCGIPDASHFVRRFRQRYLRTPRMFRRDEGLPGGVVQTGK